MLFYLALTKILSLKGYWAHTRFSPIHIVVVEVAIRIHIEHVSITVVEVIRRHSYNNRLTKLIITLKLYYLQPFVIHNIMEQYSHL